MKTIAVFSGGALNGAWHAGVGLGLADAGIVPDLMLGVSTGSLFVAYCGSGDWRARVEQYAAVWRGLTSVAQLRTGGIPRAVWRVLTGQPSLGTFAPLRKLLNAQLQPATRSACVGVTSLGTGEFRVKPTTAAYVEASCSVPPATAPVYVDGDWYADGGIRHVCPIGPAFDLARTQGWASESFRIIASVAGSLPDPSGVIESPATWSGGNVVQTIERVVSILSDGQSSADLNDALRINELVRAKQSPDPEYLSAPITVLRNSLVGDSWTVDPLRIANQITAGRNAVQGVA